MNLEAWREMMLSEMEALREAAAKADHPSVADLTRMRKMASAEVVAAAMDLAKARRKAPYKFGDGAKRIVADPTGVEMASTAAAAAWKAARFSRLAAGGRVLDLCCGIGGDAMGLRAAGLDVLAVDADPVRAWMAGVNAGCATACGDAIEVAERAPAMFHLDPARRDRTGKRAGGLDDLEPAPGVIRRVIDVCRDGAVKLAPGVDFGELAVRFGPGEVEIISERGRLTQAVLWCGGLSTGDGLRTATMLPEGLTMTGVPDGELPVAEIGPLIFEADDSVERAELMGGLCAATGAAMVHPRLGLLTAAEDVRSPWCRGFRVLETFAWNERRVKEILKRHGAGVVEVKTRDKVANPDELQPKLSVKGGEPTVLFVLRFTREIRGIVARRID